jgi:hypothetical protein
VTIAAGWAGPARARMAQARAAQARVALVPLFCLRDLPSYARNATAPIDPSGCSGRGPNANRGRIADMRPAGMGSGVLAQRIHREVLARRAHTRRKINRGSTRQPARQLQQALSSCPPVLHALASSSGFGPADDEIRIVCAALRAAQPPCPGHHSHRRTVLFHQFCRVGLKPVQTGLAPHDQPDLGR